MKEGISRDKKLCACGCGKYRNCRDKKGRTRRFIKGHQSRLENNPKWKGGRFQDIYGYIQVRLYRQTIPEHRLIMERHLGRKLTSKEDIHHINGIKNDNRLENLQLLSEAKHNQLTALNRWKLGKLTYDIMNKTMSRSEINRKAWITRKKGFT
jgi:hypothetical protein